MANEVLPDDKGIIVTPILNVSDVPASVRWFEALGWKRSYMFNAGGMLADGVDTNEAGPAIFACLRHGWGQIFLSLDSEGLRGGRPAAPGSGDDVGATWEVWWMQSAAAVDAMHQKALALGATVISPPEVKPWQQYELRIAHPEGHVFRVCSPPPPPKPRRPSVAFFGHRGAEPASHVEAYLAGECEAVERVQLDDTPVTRELLDKYSVIILDRLARGYSPEEAALIEAWVAGGGGLMAVTGHVASQDAVDQTNSILRPLGLGFNTSKGFFSGSVVDWTPHALSEGVTSMVFLGGLFVDMAEGGANAVIGTRPEGPVAVVQTHGAGRVFVWGDEWILFDSQWEQLVELRTFWANILGWLSKQRG